MAPTPDPLTVRTTSTSNLKSLGRKPITTQEKVAAHRAKKEAEHKPKTMSPPRDTDAVKKKSKPKYLAPPGEVFQPSKPKVTDLGKASSRRDKPVTTQEKIKQNEYKKMIERTEANRARAEKRKAMKAEKAAAVRKEGEKGEKGEGKEEEGVGESKEKEKGKGKTKAKLDFPSTLALLSMTSTPSAVKFEDTKGKAKGMEVLYRPTTRALGEKQAMAATTAHKPAVLVAMLKPGETKAQPVFNIMKLPKEVRSRIWKLAVVHHPFCVWPGQPRGREQPDLAMSGREVREEVLPVYYRMNVFAIDITPLPKLEPEAKVSVETKKVKSGKGEHVESKGKMVEGEYHDISEPRAGDEAAASTSKQVSSISKPEIPQKASKPTVTKPIPDAIAEIKPWVKAIEAGGHLSQIQHWVFDYTPQIMKPPSRIPKIDVEKSLGVYLNIWRQPADASEIKPEAPEPDTILAATASTAVWRANVEIHRSACCILPRHAHYHKCIIKASPACLNGMVDCVLRAAEKRGRVTADMIVGVAEILRKRADEFVAARCDDTVG